MAGFTIEENGFVKQQTLWSAIINSMLNNGFDLVKSHPRDAVGTIDFGTDSPTVDTDMGMVILTPTAAVDPVIADQPWNIVIQADNSRDEVRINVCTPTQILIDENTDEVSIASYAENKLSGYLSKDNFSDGDRPFYRRTGDGGYPGLSLTDEEAVPMSYRLSITDHGVAVMTWVESLDKDGNKFSWFVIQRPIDKEGVVLTEGKSPLFCVFSQEGGGHATDVNAVLVDGILKFVVREADVNTPTPPVSAVSATADSNPIINPIQQVAISENNKYVINFPQGLNSQRHAYPHELDMIAYTSADVISQYAEVALTMYGEATERKYRALNANAPNNKGMRILFIVQGAGIPVPV